MFSKDPAQKGQNFIQFQMKSLQFQEWLRNAFLEGESAQFLAVKCYQQLKISQSLQQTKEILKQRSPQSGVCQNPIDKGAWCCLDCQADSSCIICPSCFENSDHKGHRYMFKQYSSGCCDCGDPDAWKPEGFCKDHKGQNIDSMDIEPFADFYDKARSHFQVAIWCMKSLNVKILRKYQGNPDIKKHDNSAEYQDNLENVLAFFHQFIEINSVFKRILSDLLIEDPLVGTQLSDLNLLSAFDVFPYIHQPQKQQKKIQKNRQQHTCKPQIYQLLNVSIDPALISLKRKLYEADKDRDKLNICVCSPLELLIHSAVILKPKTVKHVQKLFFSLMGSIKFKHHFAYSYILNLTQLTLSKNVPCSIIHHLNVQFLTVPQIAQNCLENPVLSRCLSRVFGLYISYLHSKSRKNSNQQEQQQQYLKVDTFHIIYPIKHIIESTNSNQYLDVQGEFNFIKSIIEKSSQLNFAAPQVNLSKHTQFDISPIGGLDLNLFILFWEVMEEAFMILDYKSLSSISNVLIWLKNIISTNPAKEFDFEQNGRFWITISHRLFYIVLQRVIFANLYTNKEFIDSIDIEQQESKMQSDILVRREQESAQSAETQLTSKLRQLVKNLLCIESQNEFNKFLEQFTFCSVKIKSFMDQIDSDKWNLLGQNFKVSSLFYHKLLAFNKYDIGLMQISILLHNQPQQLIQKIVFQYYPINSWLKSALTLLKFNLFQEKLVNEIKNEVKNFKNLSLFYHFVLSLMLDPTNLFFNLFQANQIPKARQQTHLQFLQNTQSIAEKMMKIELVKLLFQEESSISYQKIVKRLYSFKKNQNLVKCIKDVSQAVKLNSGEVKFRLKKQQAAKIDCFMYQKLSQTIACQSRAQEYSSYEFIQTKKSPYTCGLPLINELKRRFANSQVATLFQNTILYSAWPELISREVTLFGLRGVYQCLKFQNAHINQKKVIQKLKAKLQIGQIDKVQKRAIETILRKGMSQQISSQLCSPQDEQKQNQKELKKKLKLLRLRQKALSKLQRKSEIFISSKEQNQLDSSSNYKDSDKDSSNSSFNQSSSISLQRSNSSQQSSVDYQCCVCHQSLGFEDFMVQHPWGSPAFLGNNSLPKNLLKHQLMKFGYQNMEQEKQEGKIKIDWPNDDQISETLCKLPHRYIQKCPHFVHFKCMNDAKLKSFKGHYSIQHYCCIEFKQFLCPLCKSLSNSIFPPIFGDLALVKQALRIGYENQKQKKQQTQKNQASKKKHQNQFFMRNIMKLFNLELNQKSQGEAMQFQSDYAGLNSIQQFFKNLQLFEKVNQSPQDSLFQIALYIYSALFRTQTSDSISVFFMKENENLIILLESLQVLINQKSIKNLNQYVQLLSIEQKVLSYEKQKDYEVHDKIFIISYLIDNLLKGQILDGNKVIQLWFDKLSQNIVLLNHSNWKKQKGEKFLDQQKILVQLRQLICTIQLFIPNFIKMWHIEQMSSPLFKLQMKNQIYYYCDVLSINYDEFMKQLEKMYKSHEIAFNKIQNGQILEQSSQLQKCLQMTKFYNFNFQLDLPHILQDFQQAHVNSVCSECGENTIKKAICLICRKLVCVGRLSSGKAHHLSKVGPLTSHAALCNQGECAFITIQNGQVILTNGKFSADGKAIYVDQFGGEYKERDHFGQMWIEVSLDESRVKEIIQILISNRIRSQCAKQITLAKRVYRVNAL